MKKNIKEFLNYVGVATICIVIFELTGSIVATVLVGIIFAIYLAD